jgi:hypothetical protein
LTKPEKCDKMVGRGPSARPIFHVKRKNQQILLRFFVKYYNIDFPIIFCYNCYRKKIKNKGKGDKMSLNKAIFHKKEHRKEYYGSKAIDRSCRNHGGCSWCEENRKYKYLKESQKTLDKMKEWCYN